MLSLSPFGPFFLPLSLKWDLLHSQSSFERASWTPTSFHLLPRFERTERLLIFLFFPAFISLLQRGRRLWTRLGFKCSNCFDSANSAKFQAFCWSVSFLLSFCVKTQLYIPRISRDCFHSSLGWSKTVGKDCKRRAGRAAVSDFPWTRFCKSDIWTLCPSVHSNVLGSR